VSHKTAIVIGAGAFGTCIASVLSHNFEKVILKVRSVDVYQGICEGENKIYLPGIKLASNIVGAHTWEELDKIVEKENGKVELIVSGLPTGAIKSYFSENKERFDKYLDEGAAFCSLSKGIDPETLELPDDYFYHYFPDHKESFTFLSGPSFAKEVMEKQITLVSLAGQGREELITVSKMLSTSYFKAFISYDVKGVLLGGALKNILAIAGGVIEGLGYNHNTRAGMITRGITEMLRFGHVMNSRPETFYGLAGMGDLILTTTGSLSRNKSFGLELAKGRKPQEIIDSQRTVVEGYKTTKAAYLLARKYSIRSTIFDAIYQVLYEGADPKAKIEELMATPPRFEHD
jgi:glycerol-3-phosphate dehydrogenase (NAD(P)+)